MSSFIAAGRVGHVRRQPVEHVFDYPVYFFSLDVDELPALNGRFRFFGFNRWNILSLRERDYLAPASGSLRLKAEKLLREQGLTREVVSIQLVTQLRYWGWVFNPVSFFFCRDAQGELIAVIADVNNTFGEGHAYVLLNFTELGGGRVEARAPKVFHVSPFFERKGEYRFEFDLSSPLKIQIALDYEEGGELKLTASWRGNCFDFESARIWPVLLNYPFAGWLTMVRIHFHAGILYFVKKLPIFKKPAPDHPCTLRKPK